MNVEVMLWCIPALRMLRQEEHEFAGSLGWGIVKPVPKAKGGGHSSVVVLAQHLQGLDELDES